MALAPLTFRVGTRVNAGGRPLLLGTVSDTGTRREIACIGKFVVQAVVPLNANYLFFENKLEEHQKPILSTIISAQKYIQT